MCLSSFFFFTHPATTEIYTLSLHDALPISQLWRRLEREGRLLLESTGNNTDCTLNFVPKMDARSEEHTSELQSLRHLVCRLLLEKKKKIKKEKHIDEIKKY